MAERAKLFTRDSPLNRDSRSIKLKRLEKQLLLPSSPHEERMRSLSFPEMPDERSAEGMMLRHQMDTDIAFRVSMTELPQRRHNKQCSVMFGSSGFQMAAALRGFFLDYAHRFLEYGPNSLPASFNVIEAFLEFDDDFFLFDLRQELEHLVSINDYFGWYGTPEPGRAPDAAITTMREGVIYSYDMRASRDSFRLGTIPTQIISGVSFVRHGSELNCMLLGGENPPHVPDEMADEIKNASIPHPSKQDVVSDPSLSVSDRYLSSHPEFSRIVALTRFDLRLRRHDVKYMLADCGPTYMVHTDDQLVLKSLDSADAEKQSHAEHLRRYEEVFSAAAALILNQAKLDLRFAVGSRFSWRAVSTTPAMLAVKFL